MDSAASPRKLRIGVAGLGRAFMLMLPTLRAHPRVEVVAAADTRPEALRQFEQDFRGRGHASVEALCTDPRVDAVYVASPHELHAEHAQLAARAGRHVLVEKPMALTLSDCDAMIAAARSANVVLIVGHSHSFDAPILRTRALIDSGEYGRARMINAMYYTDFLYRPRRPEELDTRRGGGVVFSQAAHQVDVARMLCGEVRSLRAQTGAWDPRRATEGAYTALVTFDEGAFGSLTYSGYAHFDGDELCGWVAETGQAKDPGRYGAMRALTRSAASPEHEADLKNRRAYGGAQARGDPAVAHNHFGWVLVSCDRADLRPLPGGVMVYADDEQHFEAVDAPVVPRAEVLDELCDAVAGARAAVHTGEWARATLQVCLAMLASAREGREIEIART